MKIINKEYNLGNDKTIVLISDIHYYNKRDIKLLNNILDNIKQIKPNYICVTGDIIDEAFIYDEDLLIDWFKKLSLVAPILVTLGNHEYYINKKINKFKLNNEFILKLEQINNLYILRNAAKLFGNINFIGIDLGIDYYEYENKTDINIEQYIEEGKTNILLCHSPVKIEHIINSDISLVLCGHMHGGCVPRILRPIFKTRGIISPTKKLFPKYAYGLKQIGETSIITTSGIRVISHTNKFYFLTNLFSSEIVIIK